MAKHWLFVVCAVAIVGVGADDLSDFSNNLATDIGPLLVLFGESMTKQYLSESTSFWDYFIFAMAPIGIITAIVSAIRVCGHPSLRAFIGRSQEGDGIVEAELCTSTSRDVCELFNRGGITRVLGRPSILELVYHPRCDGPAGKNSDGDEDKTDLFLFQHYLQTRGSSETSDWTEVKGWTGRDQSSTASSFAPYPNISLNVGIVKRSKWVFFAVAGAGFILQAGVLALAGIGVWILGWNLNEGDNSASRDYAPTMYIAGTILMCGGMWSCAALIGQTTQELHYERTNQASSPPSRLFWLQPGPQVIGDQSFDPFAYVENTNDPLGAWTSSKKNFDEKFEFYTFFAVSAVLIGYLMQFIGLRGMKAWVSLAQLGITIVMSILRGSLRMQRLGRSDNKLANMPDMVSGHELDWLAFEILPPKPQQRSFWHVTGQYGRATNADMQSSQSQESSSPDKRDAKTGGDVRPASTSKHRSLATHRADQKGRINYEDLLRIRVRLAHLTGHVSFGKIDNREYQKWKDDYVKVRIKAVKLSAAICQAAGSLLGRGMSQTDITLRIKAVASPNAGDRATHREQLVNVTLKPPSQSTQAGWTIDSAQLEAILGLWMWSLVSDTNLPNSKDDLANETSQAERVETVRIVSAGPDDGNWHREIDKQVEMDFWLSSNSVELTDTVLTLKEQHKYGLVDLWWLVGGDWTVSEGAKDAKKRPPPQDCRRFCGWDLVYESLKSRALDPTSVPACAKPSTQQPDQQVRFRVQIYSTNNSLLDICAQELFVALAMSLTNLLTIDGATFVEKAGSVQLDSPAVNALAKAFTESGLGSHSDALLCVVPALRNQLRAPADEDVLSTLIKEAETYRRRSEWERAETLLRWACQRYSPPRGEDESSSTVGGSGLIVKALRATGELYRWSLAQRSDGERQNFGRNGVDWMYGNYHGAFQRNQEVTGILDCYRTVKEKIVQGQPSNGVPRAAVDTRQQLAKAIQDKNREEALYLLCFVTTVDFGSEPLQPALPLAVRNDWGEVISSILEMKADPNSKDKRGRTAISYCAEFGLDLKLYMDHGAFLDLLDKEQRTPLSWAAEKGHEAIVKLLLEEGANNESKDANGRMPLSWAAEGGHEATVKLLLERGADVEAEDNYDKTPLLWAAESGHVATIKLLLEKGAKTEARDRYNRTALLWATKRGSEAAIKLLLEKGANTEVWDKDDQTPLSRATMEGHEAIVKLLLEGGANTEADDGDNQKPLLCATERGNEAIIKLLLEKGANIEGRGRFGCRPLLRAAEKGHEATVKLLLENGAKIEAKDDGGRTPLLWATYGEHEATIKRLLEKGADIEVKGDYGWTPLLWAAEKGHEATAKLLLEKGANIQVKDSDGWTPLLLATLHRHEAVVKLLLEKGANTEEKDRYGQTALLLAAEKGHEAIIKLLLEKGADTEVRDRDGRTPLSWAVKGGYEATIKLLLEKGTNIEAKESDGRTSLVWAAMRGYEGTAKLLLEKGANTEVRDSDDRTALSWAARQGHVATVKLLLENGANTEVKDSYGWTPLLWATEQGYEAMVKLLQPTL